MKFYSISSWVACIALTINYNFQPYNPRVNARITAGFEHSMVIDGGYVYSWGSNLHNQVGASTSSHLSIPTLIPELENVIALAQGSAANHSLALQENGTVWAWGANTFGQLGIANADISKLAKPKMVDGIFGVVALAAGRNHSVALKDDGTVWTWGDNTFGQLGLAGQKLSLAPKQISQLSDIVAVSAGYHHTLALKKDGTVWAWGKNLNGQLGSADFDATSIPTQVKGLENVVFISSGAAHGTALKGDGTVWSWGWNDYGQLGNGNFQSSNIPLQLAIQDVVKISAGGLHTVALTTKGEVYSWGANTFGQLGKSTNRNYSKPVKVFSLKNVISIVAGDMHSVAILGDGSVKTWGSNSNYQLGIGEDLSSNTALKVFQVKSDLPIALTALNNKVPNIAAIENKYEPINEQLIEKGLVINADRNVTKGVTKGAKADDNASANNFEIPETFGAIDDECPIEATLKNINLAAIRTSDKNTILLQWEAPLDVNSLDFVVEKSFNNHTWIEMDIEPIIKETKNGYMLMAKDEAAASLNVFYRLRQVNCSDEFKYSVTTIMDSNVEGMPKFVAAPDLAKDYFILSVNHAIGKGHKYELIDSDERVVLSGRISENTYNQAISVSIRTLQDGLYTLRIIKNKKVAFTTKIFKVED